MLKTYTISSLYDKPCIKLTGKWLEKNDFKIGDKVQLHNDNGILVLVKLSEEEANQMNKLKEMKKLKKQLKELEQN